MAVLPTIASFLAVLLSLCILHALPTGGSASLSFSAKLIHRDNPESPAYDPASTPLSRIRAAVQRRVASANYFRNASASANSNSRHLTAIDGGSFHLDGAGYHGTFLVELGMGEPQQLGHFGISTVEGMSIAMCKTYENYDERDAPFFDHKASTTYRTVPCLSDSCDSIRNIPCDSARNSVCKYQNRPYGRRIIINGTLSTETVHLRNPIGGWVGVHGIHFGCTYRMETLPDDGTLGRNRRGIGILGINSHRLSLLSQLRFATNGKLPLKVSYCLPSEYNMSSWMHFGELSPYNERSYTTPLFVNQFRNIYYLQLERIFVYFDGQTPVHISVNQSPQSLSDRGNMEMDSSSPITHISESEMLSARNSIISGMHGRRRVKPPKGLHPAIELCYDWHNPDARVLPVVVFTFKNHAMMPTRDLFSVVKEGVICLLLASARFTLGVRVLGIGAQLDHRISIDLENKEVNFYRNNCDS